MMDDRDINLAKVTISRQTDRCNDSVISLSINDSMSGNRVVEVVMTMSDFAHCFTGLSYSPAQYKFVPTVKSARNYGKKRVIDHGFCEKISIFNDDRKQTDVVKDHFLNNWNKDWSIQDDGTGSQQPNKKHKYSVVRYVTPEQDNG